MEMIVENLIYMAHFQFSHHSKSEAIFHIVSKQMTMRIDACDSAQGNLSVLIDLIPIGRRARRVHLNVVRHRHVHVVRFRNGKKKWRRQIELEFDVISTSSEKDEDRDSLERFVRHDVLL